MSDKRNTGEKNLFFGKRHTEETRRKMSEAAKRRRERERAGGYRLLIAAIVNQAVKDGAAWFFETETGKGCCAVAGINSIKLIGGRV